MDICVARRLLHYSFIISRPIQYSSIFVWLRLGNLARQVELCGYEDDDVFLRLPCAHLLGQRVNKGSKNVRYLEI